MPRLHSILLTVVAITATVKVTHGFSFLESLFGSDVSTSTQGYILDASSSSSSPLQYLGNSNSIKDGIGEVSRTFDKIFGGDHGGDDGGSTLPPIVERRLYNTSWAVTIPLFSFKFPHIPGGGFIANQAIYTVFSFAIIIITFGLSFLFTGEPITEEGSSRSMKKLDSMRHSNFNFMGSDLTQSLGIDGLQCLQKMICQANRAPTNKKFGLLSSAVQLVFPPPANASLEIGRDQASPSAFTSAARNGKYSKEYCEQLYDCILDPLDSARYLAHYYGHHSNARFLLKMVDF